MSEFYNEEEHGSYRDVSTMDPDERAEWRETEPDEYEANLHRQSHHEGRAHATGEHPVHPFRDQRVLDLEENEFAHGGPTGIMAARAKERERLNPDPMAAGSERRTLPEDIELQASRLRKKHNIE